MEPFLVSDLILLALTAAGVLIVGVSGTLFGVVMARFGRLESRVDDLDRRDRHDSRDIRGHIASLMAQRHEELGDRIDEFINGFRHLVGVVLDRSLNLRDYERERDAKNADYDKSQREKYD